MATNFAAMQFSRSAAAYLRATDPGFTDTETTQPTQSDKVWSFEQWLEALADGECDCETVIQGVRESIAGNADACWELLALVDQYYRLHRIKKDDFHSLKRVGQELLAPLAPEPEATSTQSHVTAAQVAPTPVPATPTSATPTEAPPALPPTPAPQIQATARRPASPAAPAPSPVAVKAAPVRPAPLRPAPARPAAVQPAPTTPPPAAKRAVAVNDVLRGRYRIDGILGRGGMGTVYAATDLFRPDYIPAEQRIALKVLHTEVVRRPGLLTELRSEFQCLQSLSHPNIVRVDEFDQDGDLSFFTMEQLSGAPLGKVIAEQQSKTLHRPYALSIIQQAAAAVAYAHSKGIVHGDLNPANIYITEWGEIRVLDFGAAYRTSRIQSMESMGDTYYRTTVATPSYASCEQLEGKEPTTEDNVYAMACITYVLLTGEHPFKGRNALAARKARQNPRRPDDLKNSQWRALKAALSFDPRVRPADMQVWLDRLDLPPLPPRLPSLFSIMSERPPPKRVGPPLVTALIAIIAGVCWWTQDQYGWLDVQSTHANTVPSAGAPASVNDAPQAAPVTPRPVTAPAVAALSAAPAPDPLAQAVVSPPAPVAAHTAAQAPGESAQGARIELAANTVDVAPMQPVASVVVSRRHSYRQEVKLHLVHRAWHGKARPGLHAREVANRIHRTGCPADSPAGADCGESATASVAHLLRCRQHAWRRGHFGSAYCYPGHHTRIELKLMKETTSSQPFLSDIKTLRERARKNIGSGNVTYTYEGDAQKTIEILQSVLATEIVCVLRYTMHAVTAAGIASESVKAEFQQHADEERAHMLSVAERINQLGGTPNFDPKGLETRSASEYGSADNADRHDPGEPDRRTHCGRSLPRADPGISVTPIRPPAIC